MSSIERQPAINPPEDRDDGPARTVVVVHAGRPEPEHAQEGADRARAGRHRVGGGSWLDLVERSLQSWPITLRVALLLVVLFTGTAAVAAVLGVAGQLVLAGLGLRAHQRHRRRLAELRSRIGD